MVVQGVIGRELALAGRRDVAEGRSEDGSASPQNPLVEASDLEVLTWKVRGRAGQVAHLSVRHRGVGRRDCDGQYQGYGDCLDCGNSKDYGTCTMEFHCSCLRRTSRWAFPVLLGILAKTSGSY